MKRTLFVLCSLLVASAASADIAPGRLVRSFADLRRASLAMQSRYVVRNAEPAFPLEVPSGSFLRLGFGVAPQAWKTGLEEIAFTVSFESEEHRTTLFRRTLVTADRSGWYDAEIALDSIAGRPGRLRMEAQTLRGKAPAAQQVLWSNPVLGPVPATDEPNIVLLSIDTLRADHLGCYGYARETSPNIDRLAREGILFRKAISPSIWTLPAHASMFTGVYPHRHGAALFGSATPLSKDVGTFPELLWNTGYRTAGFTGGGFVGTDFAFDRGFGRFLMYGGETEDRFEESSANALEWMRRPHGAPFFVFLHTYAVHMPYRPRPPYDTMFDPDYEGPYKSQFTDIDYLRFLGKDNLDDSVVEHLKALYDGGIRSMDAVLGRFIDGLRQSGLAEKTCLILTSDHGEEFKEHGNLFHHTAKLTEELVHVPLIFWCPGRFPAGRVVERQVSLVDLMPTILSIVGKPIPSGLDGESLEAVLAGKEQVRERVLVSEVDGSIQGRQGSVASVRTDDHKLVRADWDDRAVLYDLDADPKEASDVSGEQESVFLRLSKDLESVRSTPRRQLTSKQKSRVLDASTLERLRALGYAQ